MKTFAMALDLKNDQKKIEKYIDYHRNVWAEVTEGLLSIGITEMKIFLNGNRLFMFLRTEDNFDLYKYNHRQSHQYPIYLQIQNIGSLTEIGF